MRKLVRTPPTSTTTVACARKALVQRADVRRGAADVDHDRLLDAREKRRAADRIGRPGREGQHREAFGIGRRPSACRRSGVRKKGALTPHCGERLAERVDDELGEIAQARVHDRRVLALEQADAADLVRKRDMRRPAAPLRKSRPPCLEFGR